MSDFEAWLRKHAPTDYVDPLEIVNEFSMHPIEVPPCPIPIIELGSYWGKKLCALAGRCADAENKLREVLGEGVKK